MGDQSGYGRRLLARMLAASAAVFALGLTSAGGAVAATWFAANDGDGSPPCISSDPCEIYDAVGLAPLGTKVAASGGTYVVDSPLRVGAGIYLQGPWAGPPAVLVGDGTEGPAVVASGPGARVTDLSIRQSSAGTGIEIGGRGLGDRLVAETSGSAAACRIRIDGLLRDSLCTASGGGNGVLLDEDTPVDGLAEITNVTAVSAGDDVTSAALLARSQGGAQIELEATNVIAASLGAAPDVASGALIGGSSAGVDLGSSNYDSVAVLGLEATVTPVGTNSNQIEEPLFTAPESGDFSELALSPTIDAGTASAPTLGLLDLLRMARIGGAGPDIGAFEYVAPADTRAPNVSIVSAPKGKLRTARRFVTVGFELATDEDAVTFDCRIDRLPVERCTSPVTYRLRSSKGFGTTYQLTVRGTDAAGNRSGRAIRQVTVIRSRKG